MKNVMAVKTVFAIEDEEDILSLYEFLLREAGYEVYTSLTGQNILKQIALLHPDLILLDIHLGDIDGSEICREIKNNPQICDIGVILISGEKDLKTTMRTVGADDYVEKPFDIDYLLKKVQRLLSA